MSLNITSQFLSNFHLSPLHFRALQRPRNLGNPQPSRVLTPLKFIRYRFIYLNNFSNKNKTAKNKKNSHWLNSSLTIINYRTIQIIYGCSVDWENPQNHRIVLNMTQPWLTMAKIVIALTRYSIRMLFRNRYMKK